MNDQRRLTMAKISSFSIATALAAMAVACGGDSGGPQGQGPSADARGPYQGLADVAIAFDGSGSRAGDSPIQNYFWTYGDGSAVEDDVRPTHTYVKSSTPQAVNTFSVTLRVVDTSGRQSTAQTTATVERLKADAGGINGVVEGRAGSSTLFDATGSTGPFAIVEYLWDFAEGESDCEFIDPTRCRYSNLITPAHNYLSVLVPQGGTRTWDVVLIVTDTQGTADTATVQAVIENDYLITADGRK